MLTWYFKFFEDLRHQVRDPRLVFACEGLVGVVSNVHSDDRLHLKEKEKERENKNNKKTNKQMNLTKSITNTETNGDGGLME